jgi:hypothetical protein
MQILNFAMMKHPLNWVTLAIWLFALGFFLHVSDLTIAPAGNEK